MPVARLRTSTSQTEASQPFLQVITKEQENRVLADAQLDVLREYRQRGKDAYLEAHLTYVSSVQKRRAELMEILFGKTAGMDANALITASVAGEDALRKMAQIAATSGNQALGQAVLLSAYEGEEEIIHELIRILDVDALDEDDEGALASRFNELLAIDQEVVDDVDVYGEELKVRFDQLLPNPQLEDLMPGSPKRAILLGG